MHILIITTEYPKESIQQAVPFIVRDVELLRAAGVDVEIFAFEGHKRLANYAKAWFNVHKLLNMSSYDLVHAQFGQSAVPALFQKTVPLIVTFRGSDVEGIFESSGRYTFQGKILQLLSKFVALLSNECICVSDRLARKLPRREYHIIPSGLNLDLFKPLPQDQAKDRLGFDQDKHYILFGGNPKQPVKRLYLAQQVMEIVKEKISNVELVLPVNIPHDNMPIYMSACDLLLLTSVHEGSPNIVKESLACNLPIVSTDVGDVRDKFGGICGVKVCNTDLPSEIADAVISLLRRDKRVDGRPHIMNFEEHRMTQKIIDVYNLVLK